MLFVKDTYNSCGRSPSLGRNLPLHLKVRVHGKPQLPKLGQFTQPAAALWPLSRSRCRRLA
eukprot:scaffold3128_cov300-Prasinococcus_capsulatus_cf.AAC.2